MLLRYDGAVKKKSLISRFLAALGPGFVTGAADDDPSGIATYSQTGAQFGYTQLWLAPFSYPFMTAIQEMCGRIGLVTGMGLSSVIKKYYTRKVLYAAVFLLLIANTINIGADLGAMAASLQLVVPLPFDLLLIAMTIFTLLLEVYIPYRTYAQILKWMAFSLLAYVATVIIIHPDWLAIARATIVPHVSLDQSYLLNMAAFMGTTISPYLFFWQADEEVEEEIAHREIEGMGKGTPAITKDKVMQMRLDTGVGMLFSNIITFFIMATVAATLGLAGIRNVSTATDAANALRPLAGDYAFLLFALGIIGTGLLAVPILAGSAAYAVAEIFDWEEGLSKKFREAHGFYGIITFATLIGLLVNFTSIGSMTMLYYSAVVNGVLAPPLMVIILLVANNKNILGSHTNGRISNTLGVIITAIMGLTAIGLLFTFA